MKKNKFFILSSTTFYPPVSNDRGHIVLPLSVCPSARLHKLNMKT